MGSELNWANSGLSKLRATPRSTDGIKSAWDPAATCRSSWFSCGECVFVREGPVMTPLRKNDSTSDDAGFPFRGFINYCGLRDRSVFDRLRHSHSGTATYDNALDLQTANYVTGSPLMPAYLRRSTLRSAQANPFPSTQPQRWTCKPIPAHMPTTTMVRQSLCEGETP
jgi:hypothetical protein